jgi:hypothetical protein
MGPDYLNMLTTMQQIQVQLHPWIRIRQIRN